MKTLFNLILFILAGFSIMSTGCKSSEKDDMIPSLDEVSGIWVSADTVAMEPSVRNFRGVALLNRDATSLSWFVSAPYSGGYHTGVMRINGKVPEVSMFRWTPYEALRKSNTESFEVNTETRMLPEQDGILWRIQIENTDTLTRDLNIDLDMIGFISKYGGDWQWWYPYPKMNGIYTTRDDEVENVRKHLGKVNYDSTMFETELINGKPVQTKNPVKWPTDNEILECSKYSAAENDGVLFVSDTETPAVTGFGLVNTPDRLETKNSGGTASWTKELGPGEKFTIEYLMSYGDNKQTVEQNILAWKSSFNTTFNAVKSFWEVRWQQIFTPNNPLISGCFPVLETDDAKAKKVYYTSPLTMLYLMNTNLPQHKKVFLTGGPKWGASITFFWDITEWSTLFSVVDPDMMKEHITSWIGIDPGKNYGMDNFGGKGVGNGYSANYWALFQLMRSYITSTGDTAFLSERINGRTVIETLEFYATNYERISLFGEEGCTDPIYKLADFGDDEWNLLECVPTYKHIVPSFNAGYIWMMRETAKLYRYMGNVSKASEMEKKAEELVPLLMKLYKGEGVWNSLYPGNKEIEVRHCLDFMFLGRYLPKDIPDSVSQEMIDFVYRELMTKTWMRAQSLLDPAAKNSDRPDHGPLGAFDGWPAGTMDALTQMSQPQKALDFYRAIEPVTYEGSWAQAHELWGENKENENSKVRIAERGWHARDASAGTAMAQVMLKCFFNFNPGIDADPLKNNGIINLEGTMHHVLYKGNYYSIRLHEGKTTMERE